MAYHNDLHFTATELRLGLPGVDDEQQAPSINNKKRPFPDTNTDCGSRNSSTAPPPPKAQIVGWPPVRSCRKKSLFEGKKSGEMDAAMYVKVSMDGAAYLRKIDLKVYEGYSQLLKAVEAMFKFNVGRYSEREGYEGSEYAPTYQDKDGDWMLVGDVPWDMFISSCTKLRIMKGSEAKGLTCGL